MLKSDRFPTWTMAFLVCCSSPMAFAQENEDCKQISQAVNASDEKNVVVIEDRLLYNEKSAVPCLVDEIGKIGSRVELFDRVTAAKMMSATGALRTIMSRAVSSPTSQQISPGLRDFIEDFRGVADKNLNVVSALSLGMRDDNPDLRLNSVLIAGNVIDDNTVCVPLTHLNDKGLAANSIGVRGRANLLSVVNVVAPWATKQNFDTMSTTREKIESTIRKDDPNFTPTVALLDNVKIRLGSQTDDTNRKFYMDQGPLSLCKKYISEARSKLMNLDEDNLKY
jgi:hypothetical protein